MMMPADPSNVLITYYPILVPRRWVLLLMLGVLVSAHATNDVNDDSAYASSREAKTAGIYSQFVDVLIDGHDFNTITQKPTSLNGEAGNAGQEFGAQRKAEIKRKIEAFFEMTRHIQVHDLRMKTTT